MLTSPDSTTDVSGRFKDGHCSGHPLSEDRGRAGGGGGCSSKGLS